MTTPDFTLVYPCLQAVEEGYIVLEVPITRTGVQCSQHRTTFEGSSQHTRVINVDKNAAYPKAFGELKAAGFIPESCEWRQVKYLNNLVEQDHRFIKRLTKPGMGCFSFETAWRKRPGYEIMNIIMRKGHMHGVEKGDGASQVALVAKLFRAAA